ncbi:sigma-70 family RNA polymerase sigma factor, partial [uncultured Salinisphaera sp.]
MADREQLAALLARTAEGDERAFQELYAATSAQLYALLLRILRNPEQARDALQDAYVRVWQKADTYAPDRGAPLTWLLSIARYRALDVLRRKRPEVAMPEEPDMMATLL